MSSPADSPGEFSWINVSASASGVNKVSQRRRVMQHVHKYRRTQRKQEAQRLLESSRFRTVPIQDENNENSTDDTYNPSAIQTQRFPAGPLLTQARGTQSGSASSSSSSPTSTALASRSPGIPQPIYIPPIIELMLRNAECDDIDMLPRPSLATANSLLFFERDCVYPAAKQLEWAAVPKDRAFASTWESDLQNNLYDNLAIHSYLSRIAATLAMVTGNAQYLETAKTFRYRGVTSLRLYLENSSSVGTGSGAHNVDIPRLYRALISLLFAESALNDRAAMATHVSMLRDIFLSHHDKLLHDPSINHLVFMSIIYQDVQLAVLTMSSTFFDLSHDEWIERQVRPIWTSQIPRFNHDRALAATRLHLSLTGEYSISTRTQNPELTSLLLDADEIFTALHHVRIRARTIVDSMTWVYFLSRFVFVTGRLMNLLASLRADLSWQHPPRPAATLSPLSPQSIQLPILSSQHVAIKRDMILCLCTIFWLREAMGSENMYLSDQLRIWVSNPVIVRVLCETLDGICLDGHRGEESVQKTYSDHALEFLIWALWPGCFADTPDRAWFVQRLRCVMARLSGGDIDDDDDEKPGKPTTTKNKTKRMETTTTGRTRTRMIPWHWFTHVMHRFVVPQTMLSRMEVEWCKIFGESTVTSALASAPG